MGQYVLRRLVGLLPVWLAVSLLAFVLGRLAPGDPVYLMLERQWGRPPAPSEVAVVRQQLGLDLPPAVQYARWLLRAVGGDLGISWTDGGPVWRVLTRDVEHTLALALAASVLTVLMGVPAGVLAAARRHSAWDHLLRLASLVLASMPGYWLGYLLILVFGVALRWLPVAGAGTPMHLLLPALALAARSVAIQARLARAALLEVLGEDFVRTARAKGADGARVLFVHALRNAALPLVTVLGLQLGHMVLGAVVVEFVFARPGLGRVVLDAIGQRDYPVIQGFVLLAGTVFVIINLVVDVAYALLDPRVRYGGEAA